MGETHPSRAKHAEREDISTAKLDIASLEKIIKAPHRANVLGAMTSDSRNLANESLATWQELEAWAISDSSGEQRAPETHLRDR